MLYSVRHLTKFLYKSKGKRKHYGDADASALGPYAAVPYLSVVGQSALPGLLLIATTWRTMCIISIFRGHMGSW